MLQIDLAKVTNTTVADPGVQVRGGGSALKILSKGSISLPESCGPQLLLSSKNKGGGDPGPSLGSATASCKAGGTLQ